MKPEYKYSFAVFAIIGLFSHFIACGAQMYKVNVSDDHETPAGGIPAEASNPSSPIYGLHAPGGWVNLPIPFYYQGTMSAQNKTAIKKAIAIWEKAAGRKLFSFGGETQQTGDKFKDLYSSLNDPVNGFYLDYDWEKTGKSKVVLATTIWNYSNSNPSKMVAADMRYNFGEYIGCDALKGTGCAKTGVDYLGKQLAVKEVYDFQTITLHELGHLIGLLHVSESYDPYSIMNPALFIGEGMAARRLSKGDIERIRRIYPCDEKVCKAPADVAAEIQRDSESDEMSLTAETSLSH